MFSEAVRRARHRYGKVTEAKLERWLGGECVDMLKFAGGPMRVPLPIFGVPAAVQEGEIVGKPWWELVVRRVIHEQRGGFSSLSDLIAEASAGKAQVLSYNQVGTTGVVAVNNHTWGVGPVPAAGAAAAAPAGGTKPIRTTTGALGQQNASGSDTLHITTMTALSTQLIGAVMAYDKLFATTTAANPGTGSISVTGTQDRYTGAANTSAYAGGVMISNRVTVALPATAHNITYGYTDQDNNAGASSGANTGRASAAVNQADLVAGQWASAFAGGDSGARQLTSIQFSASPATGQVEHFLMKPLGVCPIMNVNTAYVLDGINSAFNLVEVMDDAAITFAEFYKANTTAATIAGTIQFVSG